MLINPTRQQILRGVLPSDRPRAPRSRPQQPGHQAGLAWRLTPHDHAIVEMLAEHRALTSALHAVIVVVLAVVTVASLVKTRSDPTATAHAGSPRPPICGCRGGARWDLTHAWISAYGAPPSPIG